MRKLLNAAKVRFNNAGRTGVENPIEFLQSINPMQFVKHDIYINVFRVKYKYTTSRGNKKQGVKYFIVNSVNPEICHETLLRKWVEEYNIKNKHRQISNVKLLDSCLFTSLVI